MHCIYMSAMVDEYKSGRSLYFKAQNARTRYSILDTRHAIFDIRYSIFDI